MKHLDDKYFVPFPEYFKGKEYDTEVISGIDVVYQYMPMAINIIFTRSEDLQEIKRVAAADWEYARDEDLSYGVKLAIQKIYEKLNNESPSEPRFSLVFKKGPEGYYLSEGDKTLIVFVDSDILPDPKKIFFFKSDFF